MREGRDPRTDDITYGGRRISRPDASLPDWEVPDTAYRPIPIVWFTGALIAQWAALAVIGVGSALLGEWLAIALAGLATVAIGKWTWQRGMNRAPRGWQIATIVMAIVQLAGMALITPLIG